jgi:hypothetical protein
MTSSVGVDDSSALKQALSRDDQSSDELASQVTDTTQDIKPIQYEERYVAFVDILGFSELIRRSENDDEGKTLRLINDALSFKQEAYLELFCADSSHNTTEKDALDLRIHTFSDFVVVSTPHTPDGLLCLLHVCWQIGVDWLRQGFLCRGGISVGKLVHSIGNHTAPRVFGPAFVAAYDLEHNVADFPRIVLSSQVRRAHEARLKASETKEALALRLVRKCEDGPTSVDLFWHLRESSAGNPHRWAKDAE